MARICLDVNVWVNHYLAVAHRRSRATAAGQWVNAVFDGECPIGDLQVVISHAMLDTLHNVLRRLAVVAPFADLACDQIEAVAGGGYLAEAPSIILGGTAAYPMLDQEDAAVLNAALAGLADLFVTNNIADFARGPRARNRTQTLAARNGKPDVLRLDTPRRPQGLVIVSVFTAAAWLIRGVRPPAAARAAMFPAGPAYWHRASPDT